MSLTSPQAIIFDFDGLMVDTEYAVYQAWQELYESVGHELPIETYVQCVGSTFASYDPMLALELLLGETPDWPKLLAEKNERIRDHQKHLDAMPGVRELLQQAQENGVKTAVASSSDAAHVHGWLDKLSLGHYFQTVCTRDDVTHAKPAPDLFLLAMGRLGVCGQQSVVLEDSANGLKAANAANVACIVVPNRITRYSNFETAAVVLPSLADTSPHKLLCHALCS